MPDPCRVGMSQYDPYRELAAAIVRQAVVDLRDAYRRMAFADIRIQQAEEMEDSDDDHAAWRASSRLLRAKAFKKKAVEDAAEVEDFFAGDWFRELSDLDGWWIVSQVRAEVFGAESEGK